MALLNKTADEVANAVEMMLKFTGPIKILQCDNGTEFMGRVLEACTQWKMDAPVHSAPYRPQTNGLIERAGGTLQRALTKWCEQYQTLGWADGVARLSYQINCTHSKATKRTPHELIFGRKVRWDSVPMDNSLDATSLLDVMEEAEPDDSGLTSPVPQSAAAALLSIHDSPSSSGLTGEAELDAQRTSQDLTRTPQVLSRTHQLELSAKAKKKVGRGPRSNDELPSLYAEWERMYVSEDKDQEYAEPFDFDRVEKGDYADELTMDNLPYGRIGLIPRGVADYLNVGPFKWYRRGNVGGGRCLTSAWLGVHDKNGVEDTTGKQSHKKVCDVWRRKQRQMLLDMAGGALATLQQQVYHVGNTGAQSTAASSGIGQAANIAAAWAGLLEDMAGSTTDLGWDAAVAMAACERINILVMALVAKVVKHEAGTRRARDLWAQAEADGTLVAEADRHNVRPEAARGGQCAWVEPTTFTTSPVPTTRLLRPELPFICLFHRTTAKYTTVNGTRTTAEHIVAVHDQGHFETLLADTGDEHTRVEAVFHPETATHDVLCQVVTDFLAAQFNDLARIRMERDYNAQGAVVSFRRLLSVGLRVASTGSRVKADALSILPCMVIEVVRHDNSSGGDEQRAEQYRLLCEYGVLPGTYKADQLVPITLRNYPQLELYRELDSSEIRVRIIGRSITRGGSPSLCSVRGRSRSARRSRWPRTPDRAETCRRGWPLWQPRQRWSARWSTSAPRPALPTSRTGQPSLHRRRPLRPTSRE